MAIAQPVMDAFIAAINNASVGNWCSIVKAVSGSPAAVKMSGKAHAAVDVRLAHISLLFSTAVLAVYKLNR